MTESPWALLVRKRARARGFRLGSISPAFWARTTARWKAASILASTAPTLVAVPRSREAELRRRVGHQASAGTPGLDGQLDLEPEELPDGVLPGPRLLQGGQELRRHHPVVAVDGGEEERALVPERVVEAAALDAHPVHEVLDRRRLVPAGPEDLHGPVEDHVALELLGSGHAPSNISS